jgi:hypothetical protein
MAVAIGSIELFAAKMLEDFNSTINVQEIGYETISLYHDEIDDLLIPNEHLESLPDPLLFDTIQYFDEEGNDWTSVITVNEVTWEKGYMVIILNGVRSKVLLFII